jgi:Mg2+/Co2+ transporter CorB
VIIYNVQGILLVRRVLTRVLRSTLTREELSASLNEPYFVPEGTPLPVQLLNFQAKRRRIGLVVDEYGEIRGLVTLEDILEEIVGEFTTDPAAAIQDVYPQADGSFLVDGSASVRELNRLLKWNMPTTGPKTLNGLILEHLEAIPEPGTSLLLDDYPVTIIQTQRHKVKMARIQPRRQRRMTRRAE